MSEYLISNGAKTVAINLEDGTWRVVGPGAKAFHYEWDTGELYTSYLGACGLLEHEGSLTDFGFPVLYVLQTASVYTDAGQLGMASLLLLDLDTQGQLLTPSILLGEDDTTLVQTTGSQTVAPVVTLPSVTTTGRRVIEIPLTEETTASRMFGVRLTGLLGKRVDVFGIELDVNVAMQERV